MSIALSLFVDDAESAVAEATRLQALARWVELRLDRAPEMDFAALVEAMPLPVIAACPRLDEGGHFRGEEEARAARLQEAAAGGASFVDVPLGAPRPAELPRGTGVIHSWHEKPGENADLRVQLHRIESQLESGDVAKVVAYAEHHDDAMRSFPLYGTTRAPLVSFAMGPGGRATRAWAPVMGAPWTYASGAEATAPGQWTVEDLVALHPPGGATPRTSLFAVVGRPVGHSRSPLLWNLALRMTGFDAFYLAVEPRSFQRFLHAHRYAPFQGFSITSPYKADALAAADSADPRARDIGAANTLHRSASGWKAYNTDGPAAFDAIEAAGYRRGEPVAIVGAGGAARAVAFEARERGCPFQVVARDLAAARTLATPWGGSAASLDDWSPADAAAVLQATPVGSEAAPGNLLAGRVLAPGSHVLDMVYAPSRTALLAQAREQGAVAVPGYQMLVRQMVEQFALFTGQRVPVEPLLRTLEADLGVAA